VDEVGQRRQRLLEVGVGVWALELVEVDVIGLQAPERALDRASSESA
jgi:hypothetical protein